MMKRAGLTQLTVAIFPLHFTDYAFWREIARTDEVEQGAVTAGNVRAEALERWRGGMSEVNRDGTFFASVNMVLVAGTKPAR